MDITKILALIDVATGLFKSGAEILALLKNKTEISDDDLKAIINKQNEAQAAASAKLHALLG